jgi:hypothetical protein
MKKVLISMALALTMLSGLTAEVYRGDIQFQMGYSANDITYQDNVPSFETDNCNFGIQTWHLFGPSEFVKAGFMVNTEWGMGNSRPNSAITTSQFLFNSYSVIGPAAALDLFGVVRFNFGVGFATVGNFAGYDGNTIANMNFGVGLDVQAKFLPRFFISPIIGYRFASTFGDSNALIIDSDANVDFTITPGETTTLKNEVYAGISFNW